MNSKKTRAAYRIKQNNMAAEYTRPEVAFDSIFGNRVTKPFPILLPSGWSACPDRQFIDTKILIEIDGEYHRTMKQESKGAWRDKQLEAMGYRVLHIDAELLLVKKYHLYLRHKVEEFLKSDKPVDRVAA
jgi:very-short-patch-repair endonuclease